MPPLPSEDIIIPLIRHDKKSIYQEAVKMKIKPIHAKEHGVKIIWLCEKLWQSINIVIKQ